MLTALFFTAASVLASGTLTYPATDNIEPDQGTVECWIKLAFDPAEHISSDAYAGLLTFAALGGDQGRLTMLYHSGASFKGTAGGAVSVPQPALLPAMSRTGLLQPDEWHHIAFVWRLLQNPTWPRSR